jgi:hypothetical protein
MKSKILLSLSLLAAAILFSILSLSGCSSLDLEGPPMQNIRPWVSWAIVPSDSVVHSFNPTLHWFGNDQDGQINDIIYGVFEGDYMDSVSRITSLEIPDTLTWISLGNVTSATIPLPASPDSSDTVGQYVVLRAIDDAGDSSDIINRYLFRTNHRPTCTISVPEGPQWSLPEITDTWSGIPVSWEGGDSLDYPGAQPDFLWEVKVFGPYPNSASIPADSLFDPDTQPLWYYLSDGDDTPELIASTSFNFYNLVTGFYAIYVRNYDDADVPSRPALGVIEVYEPHWIRHPNEAKDVLLYNSSAFNPTFGNLPAAWSDSVQMFYANVLADAGIASNKWDWFDTIPTIRDFYLYRMVIIDDIDWTVDIGNTTQEAFIDYLNAGGSIWVIGRMSFYNSNQFAGRYEYESNEAEPMVFNFFGLEAAFFPPSDFTFAEFVGANAVGNSITGLPDLSVDPLKIDALNDFPGGEYTALPKVEFLILSSDFDVETVYQFVSDNPGATGSFHQFPVGVRWATPTFKSSYFSFPLFFMEYDEAAETFDDMLQWFLEE